MVQVQPYAKNLAHGRICDWLCASTPLVLKVTNIWAKEFTSVTLMANIGRLAEISGGMAIFQSSGA